MKILYTIIGDGNGKIFKDSFFIILVFNMKYENFYKLGYEVHKNILNKQQISDYVQRLHEVLNIQSSEFDESELKCIGEIGTVRSPFLYDKEFEKLFNNNFSKTIIKEIIGEHAIISLQNGIIVEPNQTHHQTFFHRDIIHQDFVTSKPISINLYYCLSDYHENNGATFFIPKSHKMDEFPKEYKEVCVNTKAGDVVLFDSMVYHRAGKNTTLNSRIGINHMITLPFIKQQIRYPNVIKEPKCSYLRRLFGFESVEHLGVKEFRNYRIRKHNAQ